MGFRGRGWLRPRLRWALVGLLTVGLLAAAASANLTSLTNERAVTPHSYAHNKTPADDQYAPLTPPAKPKIDIAVTPATQTVPNGATTTFSVVATNTGTVPLHSVAVDPPVKNCDRKIGLLKPAGAHRYTCVARKLVKSLANTLTATGVSPANTKVTDHATARVRVVVAPLTPPPTAAIALTKQPGKQTIVTRVITTHTTSGVKTAVMYAHATFTITVTNKGQVGLTNVRVRNPQSPACDRRYTSLAAHASRRYTCWSIVVRNQPANLSVASGKLRTGKPVNETAAVAVLVRTQTVQTGEVALAG
jgi:hypothetical protein